MSLGVEWLGSVPYGEALDLQKAAVEDRRAGVRGDRLLLLEHPPVVTLGRSARAANLRLDAAGYRRRGIELHTVSRGGDVTYHAPGQLVGYLVADLEARGERDVHRLLRRIESALIAALSELGLAAGRVPGWTGVFVPDTDPPRKIASIGVGLRGWVSFHGFALNVDLDLAGFDVIVPCGLHGVRMTSLAAELGGGPGSLDAAAVRDAVARAFRVEFP